MLPAQCAKFVLMANTALISVPVATNAQWENSYPDLEMRTAIAVQVNMQKHRLHYLASTAQPANSKRWNHMGIVIAAQLASFRKMEIP